MSDYQVIARKFRPQTFKEVMGQEAIVTTLKNAIKFKRLAQAYLFCGSRGTGKTTLARIFAKAINCQQPTEDFEPCNQCASCKEITSGSSLDVLEIDGASNRGIEDIRQINETVGYAAASGHYKVYIIDEVHMLTKEAFNALLKTLEEPPPKVKFFFATTEAHKVLPTILSRCQRFNLSRIPLTHIVTKLRHISEQLGADVEEEALQLLGQRAEGGLRDAESLFDQILAFSEGKITIDTVQSILGLMPREAYFELDLAGKEADFSKAFEIAHRIFAEGKDLSHFIEGLVDHFRHILLIQLSGKNSPLLSLSPKEKELYEESARLYTQEQCLDLIDYLIESTQHIRFAHSSKIALEAILLHIMRSHFRLPIEVLVRRLSELEHAIGEQTASSPSFNTPTPITASPTISTPPSSTYSQSPSLPSPPPSPPKTLSPPSSPPSIAAVPSPKIQVSPTPPSVTPKPPQPAPVQQIVAPSLFESFVSEDPTPSRADLGLPPQKPIEAPKRVAPNPAPPKPAAIAAPAPVSAPSPAPVFGTGIDKNTPMYQYDTLFQFAAIELDGRLQRNA